MIQDVLDAAIDLLKMLSFGFNQAVAVYIEDEIGERAAGFWLFLSHGKVVAVQWLGATEAMASLTLKQIYEENLTSIRSQTAAGLTIIMAELTRAAEGYADSLKRFDETYADMLNVDTPQAGIAKLEARAKNAVADKLVERLMAATFSGTNHSEDFTDNKRARDLADFRNATLHRP